ncbi:hypothetical protein BD414DRAFT_478732 [Trametes punicea]|nr:hypothetical protein BD414DRAFT_478732 [Trametes punicea]
MVEVLLLMSTHLVLVQPFRLERAVWGHMGVTLHDRAYAPWMYTRTASRRGGRNQAVYPVEEIATHIVACAVPLSFHCMHGHRRRSPR